MLVHIKDAHTEGADWWPSTFFVGLSVVIQLHGHPL